MATRLRGQWIGRLAHLLLATLVARSLDARLTLFVVGMVILGETPGTALKAGQAGAPLALGCAAMSRAHWARWAHGGRPTSGHDGGAVHATAERLLRDAVEAGSEAQVR